MSLIISSTGARQLPAGLVNNARVKYIDTQAPLTGAAGEKAELRADTDRVLKDAYQALRDGRARAMRFDTVEISGLNTPVLPEMLTPLEDCPVTLPGAFGPVQESTVFSNEEVSAAARTLSALMDENGVDINTKISFGMSEAQLAEHFGGIGRQIDDAFAAGHITEQEYADLNRGLEKYTGSISGRAERNAAMWEVGKQVAQATRRMIESGASKEEMADYAESVKENFQDRISSFVEEYCSIDRSLLNALIGRVRAGESLFPEGTVHTYGRENTAGYFKNGYVPFVPVDYI